jgi:hypothetical protein
MNGVKDLDDVAQLCQKLKNEGQHFEYIRSTCDPMIDEILKSEYGFSVRQIQFIIGKAYDDGHAGGYLEYIYCVMECANFAYDIIASTRE